MLVPDQTSFFFFFNDTATTEIYTLSLHDALPIWRWPQARSISSRVMAPGRSSTGTPRVQSTIDRKSTRLNSSHGYISYAVFCLKKKILDDDFFRAGATAHVHGLSSRVHDADSSAR